MKVAFRILFLCILSVSYIQCNYNRRTHNDVLVDNDSIPKQIVPSIAIGDHPFIIAMPAPTIRGGNFFYHDTAKRIGCYIRGLVVINDSNFWFTYSTNYLRQREHFPNDFDAVPIENGIAHFSNHKIFTYNVRLGLRDTNPTCLVADHENNIWMGQTKGGLIGFDVNGNNWIQYTPKQGLPGDNVNNIFCDVMNNLWLASGNVNERGNVTLFNRKNFISYDVNGYGRNIIVNNVFLDSNKVLWLSSSAGINSFDGKKFNSHDEVKLSTIRSYKVCIKSDAKNNLWFGTLGSGIIKYDGRSFKLFTPREIKTEEWINCILPVAKSDSVWFGTKGGLILFDGNSFKYLSIPGLHGALVLCMAHDSKGNLILGTSFEGLFKFDGKNLTHLF